MKHFVNNRNKYLSRLASGLDVLDVGCVNHNLNQYRDGGWLHEDLKRVAKSVIGIDYEADCIKTLQAEGYDVICADATNFNLGDSFDLIIAGEILEHLGNTDGFLSCARKHLRSSGKLVITVPNAGSLNYAVQNIFYGHEVDNPDHCCLYSETTLRRLLERHGLEVESVGYCPEQVWDGKGLSWWCRQVLQYACAPFRPNLLHHLIMVASPS